MNGLGRVFTLVLMVTGLVLTGCSVNSDLGGAKIPNARPDTQVVGQPPTLLEASFAISFNWDGFDPDGSIVGFEWKISDNGLDGISVRDTLTADPMTGEKLHPWQFTTAYDSTFVVLADQADFAGDEIEPRSFRSHTLFIRAVDDKGAKDPLPAMISFTATTLVPVARLGETYYDGSAVGATQAPTTATLDYQGEDPDYSGKYPAQVRYLWKKATYSGAPENDPYITEKYIYYKDDNYEEVIDFGSEEWSDWFEYPIDELERRIVIPDLDIRDENDFQIGYLFAVQVKDVAGAVSVGRGYMKQVGNFTLKVFNPAVYLAENSSILRETQTNARNVIAAYQPLNFAWHADVSRYLGEVTAYRYGWDVVNPDNPYDDNWAIPPGVSPQHLFAPEKVFDEGAHSFTLMVTDNSDQVTVIRWDLEVIPYVDRDLQKPLLLIDGIADNATNAWPGSPSGPPYYDQEGFRNVFWEEALSSVQDFVWEEDRFDHVDIVGYEDLVNYKAVILFTTNAQGTVMRQFRTTWASEKFIWLDPYQRRGGNLFFCGGLSFYGFLQSRDNYMVPIIFDTSQEYLFLNDRRYVVGFGTRTLTDDSIVERGPLQYPYKTAGIAVLDWTSPDNANIYNRPLRGKYDRRPGCAGLKALVLDDDFRSQYEVSFGGTGIPDTIYSSASIDWKDEYYWEEDLLDFTQPYGIFSWGQDEFYDVNITSTRPTPYQLQICTDAPSGYCAEPMFRSVARFDWLRNKRWADGELDWPDSRYDDMDDICGEMALTSYEGVPDRSSLTNNRVFGFISYKMFAEKDWGKADIYWGFDPYRFDHETSKKAIYWVLRYFGLQVNEQVTEE